MGSNPNTPENNPESFGNEENNLMDMFTKFPFPGIIFVLFVYFMTRSEKPKNIPVQTSNIKYFLKK